MPREQALHAFLLETDQQRFYDDMDCPSTPWTDVCVLLHLMRRYRPARFLEVGMQHGHTTRIVAERFPEMSIVGVDPGDQVPPDERPPLQESEYLAQEEIGELVREMPNVRVIKQPFQQVAWGDERFELIFIDANHFLPHVLADSLLALRLVSVPGVVVWHDFNHIDDVNCAVEQLPVADRVIALSDTWIAFYDSHRDGVQG